MIEPDQLAELGGLTAEQCESIIAYADEAAAQAEEEERKAIAEGRFKPVVTETTGAAAAVSATETVTETAAVEETPAEGNGASGEQSVSQESGGESAESEPTTGEPATMETPAEVSGGDEHEIQSQDVETQAAGSPKRVYGEQSPSLETAALDEQAEE